MSFKLHSLVADRVLKMFFLSFGGFPSVLTQTLEPPSCEKCFSAVKTCRIFALSGGEGGQCSLGSYCSVVG